MALAASRETACSASSANALQFRSKLRILLLDLELSPCGFRIRKSVHNLARGSRKLGSSLKVCQGIDDLALLQQKLRHGGHGNVTLGVDCTMIS